MCTVNQFVLVQFFLFDLQLQHDGIELHVEIVGSLQFPLVVLSDVQCMSVWRTLIRYNYNNYTGSSIVGSGGAIFHTPSIFHGVHPLT